MKKKKQISLSENHSLNKNERVLVSFLIKRAIKNKIAEVTIDEQTIVSLTKIKKEKIDRFLKNLSSKILEFYIFDGEEKYVINTNIFTWIQTQDLYVFILGHTIFNSINGDDFFSKFKIHHFLLLIQKKSFKLYNLFINQENSTLQLSVEDLKLLLSSPSTSYERFFDFEKNMLTPIINDINLNTELSIDYTKTKTGKRITHVTFQIMHQDKPNELGDYILQKYDYPFIHTDRLINRIKFLSDYFSTNELKKAFNSIFNHLQLNTPSEDKFFTMLTTTFVKNILEPEIVVRQKFGTPMELFHKLHQEICQLNLPVEVTLNFYPPELLELVYSNKLSIFQFENRYVWVDIMFSFTTSSSFVVNTI